MNFDVINATVGAGKTKYIESIIPRAIDEGELTLMVQPTIGLIGQTERNLKNLGVDRIRCFHGDVCDGRVVSELTNYLSSHDLRPQVVITTQEAFDKLEYCSKPERWKIIFDEVPKGIREMPLNIAKVNDHVLPYVDAVGEGEFVNLVANNVNHIESIVRNVKHDAAYDAVRPLALRLLQDGWDVVVDANEYRRLVAGTCGHTTLHAMAIRNPNFLKDFQSVTVASAFFEESVFSWAMKSHGCTFAPYPNLPGHLAARHHENGHLLEIHHLLLDRWSKSIQESNEELVGNYVNYVNQQMGDEKFLLISNKKEEKKRDPFEGGSGLRLPGSPYGLNNYTDYDNVVVLGAFNPNPIFSRLLKTFGMTDDDIDCAINMVPVYQAIGRCSVRVAESQTLKKFIVPDRRCAHWLVKRFPGAKVVEIPVEIATRVGKSGRPSQGISNAQRAQARRDREKLQLARVGLPIAVDKGRAETPINLSRGFQTNDNTAKLTFTIFKALRSLGPQTFEDFDDINNAVEWLERLSHRYFASKFDAGLMICAETAGTRKEHIDELHSIVLDYDAGDLTVEALAEIFPDIRMVVCNTHSSTLAVPRWRVVIFLSHYVNGVAWEILWKRIIGRIEARGYAPKKLIDSAEVTKVHGFDASKKAFSSMFFLPCQSADVSGSFFRDFNEPGRNPLDVHEWLWGQNVPECEEVPDCAPRHPPKRASNDDVVAALDQFYTWGTLPGNGDQAIGELGIALLRSGIPDSQISEYMYDAAANTNSPDEREAQVGRYLESVGRGSYSRN